MIILTIAFILSVSLNTFLIWYIINAIKKLQFMSVAFESMDMEIEAFDKHLKKIYELEMYYGDQTLEALIKHSQHLLTSFNEVREDYSIFNGDLNEDEYLESEERKEDKNDSV